MADFQKIKEIVYQGEEDHVGIEIKKLLNAGVEPLDVINQGLLPGIKEVGEAFKNQEIFLPEVMVSALTMTKGMDLLRPLINKEDISSVGTVVIGTVKGDVHDIGKNLVAMMLESSGFSVINLGLDVPVEKFITAVKEYRPDILGMSAMLTTTMTYMQTVIKVLEEEGLRDHVKVIVGGAPIFQKFADEIQADAYAPDVTAAVNKCHNLID